MPGATQNKSADTGEQPTGQEIEAIAREALDALPDQFRALAADAVIQVTDWPSFEIMRALAAATPYDILGLFEGVGRAQAPATRWTGQLPNMIWLFRQPILEYWRAGDNTLMDVVNHVLIHEIGHHFGLSDQDMTRIERRD